MIYFDFKRPYTDYFVCLEPSKGSYSPYFVVCLKKYMHGHHPVCYFSQTQEFGL